MTTCTQCLFPPNFCLCIEEKNKIKLPFRLIFIMNRSEFFKLSNSARLYLLNCYPCEIRLRGLQSNPFHYENFANSLETSQNYLLYPHKEAKEVELKNLFDPSKEQRTLIIPDGNWSQAAKIAHKLKSERGITSIALKEPPKSSYLLRTNPNPERVSTFEASFFAIKDLLSTKDQNHLENSFSTFVTQILKLRGKIPRKEN